MKRILLIYLPFCTPASPPYSLPHLSSFLKANCTDQITVDVLDLNILFHTLKFPEFQAYFKDTTKWADYERITDDYHQKTEKVYSENNWKVVHAETPEFFAALLQKVIDKKPDIVALSVVYSSQAFYAYALLTALKDLGIVTVIGGPAVNEKLIQRADKYLSNELELLHFIVGKEVPHDSLTHTVSPDFSVFSLEEYFTPHPVIPIHTSTTCYYQQCTFCSHYNKVKYAEFPLEMIKETIIRSQQKYFFLIDDMIPSQRLLQIAAMLKPLNVTWACQLRPTKDFDYSLLKQLRDAGLSVVYWGVESGNDRILQLMKKGTNTSDVAAVLAASHNAGIKNMAYILLGMPTETEQEILDTVHFLKDNKEHVDLLCISLFGLHKGTPIYNNPEAFGITQITEKERTVLAPKISYTL
ncbi:MAG: B12-binding domain-containing radical SAM protein, partial [Nanoarchaeota archaeon]